MIEGTLALQISREMVPDFAIAKNDFCKISCFKLSSEITSQSFKFLSYQMSFELTIGNAIMYMIKRYFKFLIFDL